MMWWGKLAGLIFGFLLGQWIGAIIGLAAGHFFDLGLASLNEGAPNPDVLKKIQETFFNATFSVMGYIAKADGLVTTDEIQRASAVMDEMELAPEQRRQAQKLFRQGKSNDFDLGGCLADLRAHCSRGRQLLQIFLEIQIGLVMADGVVHQNERSTLYRIAAELGFSNFEIDIMLARVQAESSFAQDEAGNADRSEEREYTRRSAHTPRESELALAYQVIGVDAQATDSEIKKAYRSLINQHHPDKLSARGLPKEMVEIANKKSQEITGAYQTIKKYRDLK